MFYGVGRRENESSEDCEKLLKELTSVKMGVDGVEFDRVHRLNGKPDSPIIACCSAYKDKIRVLKAKTKLKGSNIFVGEDFTFRVREVRRKLTPHLKEARASGKRVAMVFDHLLIDGKKFTVGDAGLLTEMK